MPKALLREILLEKEDSKKKKSKDLKIKSQGEFYAKLDLLNSSCLNIIAQITATEISMTGESTGSKALRTDLEKYMAKISEMLTDREKYQWNDDSVQDMVEELETNIKTSFENQSKFREEQLGKDDSLKFADDYLFLGDQLKTEANEIIFRIASIEKLESKAEELRKITDPLRSATTDDQLDIVAKNPILEKKPGENDDDFKKRQLDQENEIKARRDGIINLMAIFLGIPKEKVLEKFGEAGAKDKLATRIELYSGVMPFVESFTGRTYKRNEADEKKGIFDPQFIEDLSVLAEYRKFGTKKYLTAGKEKEDGTKKESFTAEVYAEIEKEMNTKREELKSLIKELRDANSGTTDKETKMIEILDEAEKELDSIEVKYTCDFKNISEIESQRKEMEDTLSKKSKFLNDKDIEIIKKMIVKIEEIEDYCSKKS